MDSGVLFDSNPQMRAFPGEIALFAVAATLYLLFLPLDVPNAPPAPGALGSLAVAAFGALPLGDGALRARLPAVLLAAATLLLLARHAHEGSDAPVDGRNRRDTDTVAALAGSAVVGATVGYIMLATRSAAGAASLALTAAAFVFSARLMRNLGSASAGLALAMAAGFCTGADVAIAALVWPPALAVTAWALRRGERWPLCAPLLFAAGAGVSLAAVVPGGNLRDLAGAVTLGPLPAALGALSPSGLRGAMVLGLGLARELGVMATLLALAGLGALLARRPAAAIFPFWFVLAGLVVASAAHRAGVEAHGAFVVAVAALAFPVTAGISALSSNMGRARAAVAATLGIIALAEPTFRLLAP